MIGLWAGMLAALFIGMVGVHLWRIGYYRKLVELQAAKIRFLLSNITKNPDNRDIAIEFMDRSFNGQDFKEF